MNNIILGRETAQKWVKDEALVRGLGAEAPNVSPLHRVILNLLNVRA